MTRLVITEPAKDELQKIWLYIAENGYADYADGQLDNILAECELLSLQPEMGSERSDISKGLRFFPINRYNIYYRYQNDTVFIMHIVNAARGIKNIEF